MLTSASLLHADVFLKQDRAPCNFSREIAGVIWLAWPTAIASATR